jgi:hypothetical protein
MNLWSVCMLPPEEICKTPLDLMYYPGPWIEITPIRAALWHLQQEERVNWKIRVIQGTRHLAALTSGAAPDILVTHWHGEYREPEYFSPTFEIARRLRRQRGSFSNSGGPFLVGQVSTDRRGLEVVERLDIYDMLIARPPCFDDFAKNLAIGMNRMVHSDSQLQFDVDFPVISCGNTKIA